MNKHQQYWMVFLATVLVSLFLPNSSFAKQDSNDELCDFLANTITSGFPNAITDLTYNATGSILASAHVHNALCLWDLVQISQQPQEIFTTGGPISIDWSNDETHLIYVTSNADNNQIVTIDTDNAQVERIRLGTDNQRSPDYNLVQDLLVFTARVFNEADATFFEEVYFYNPILGQDLSYFSLPPRTEPMGDYIRDIALNPFATSIAIASRDGLIVADKIGNHEVICSLPEAWDKISLNTIDWHPYDDIILTGGRDDSEGELLLWRLDNDCIIFDKNSLETFPLPIQIVQFSSDGNWIAVSDSVALSILNYNSLELIAQYDINDISSLTWHPSGEKIAIGTFFGEIIELDFIDLKLSLNRILLSLSDR